MLTVWLFPDGTCAVRVVRQEKDTQSVLAVFGVDETGIAGGRGERDGAGLSGDKTNSGLVRVYKP